MIFRKFREGFKKSAKYCLLSNWHDFLHEFGFGLVKDYSTCCKLSVGVEKPLKWT